MPRIVEISAISSAYSTTVFVGVATATAATTAITSFVARGSSNPFILLLVVIRQVYVLDFLDFVKRQDTFRYGFQYFLSRAVHQPSPWWFVG